MIRELLDQRADLAIVDLTITYNREQVVDFTMPFMNLGISILYRKPVKQPPNLFSFLSPLSLDVWCYMAVSFFFFDGSCSSAEVTSAVRACERSLVHIHKPEIYVLYNLTANCQL